MSPVMYYSHNLHFLAVSSSMEGDYATAHRAAEDVVASMQPYLKENPMAEWFVPTRTHVLVRFRRRPEILKLQEPGQNLRLAHSFWMFARGMAFSATGQPDKAQADRAELATEAKSIPAETMLGFNSVHQLLDLAGLMLDANIARTQQDYKQAEELLAKAAEAEDALNYD